MLRLSLRVSLRVRAHSVPANSSFIAVNFFNSNGSPYEVAGLSGDQVTRFSFAVAGCNSTYNACMLCAHAVACPVGALR